MNKNIFLVISMAVLISCIGCKTEPKPVIPKPKQEPVVAIVDEKVPEPVAELSMGSSLDEKIGSMLMVGFMGTTAPKGSQICNDILTYNLAGVILFDVNPVNKKEPKNIANKEQVRLLTEQLQACSQNGKLLISVDQEGGGVQRLKRKYGFYGRFPKAKDVKNKSEAQIRNEYFKMGEELNSVGINYNLAPVVDLAINKRNKIIYKYGRSFGANPKDVAKYSNIFIDAMRSNGVLTSLKHFPGHGSSLGDTHKGFVDVTNLWNKKELEPYRLLSERGVIDTVMVAHVFNKKIDSEYPATLSSKTIKGLLREDIGFDGVVITDDLQMGAIGNYTLRDRLKLTIGAGNDILLFGNQLSINNMVTVKELVDMVKEMVYSGEVSLDDIEKSNERMEILRQEI